MHARIETEGRPVNEGSEIGGCTPIYTPDGPATGPGEILESAVG
jgi:hypothetical protein